MDMFPVRYTRLNCQGFAEAVSENVTVTELEDWTGKVPHAGYGGASKSSYTSPKGGKTIYVLERNSPIPPDGYTAEVWQFREDFDAAEAAAFLEAVDVAGQVAEEADEAGAG